MKIKTLEDKVRILEDLQYGLDSQYFNGFDGHYY